MSNFGAKVHEVLERIGKDPTWLAAQTGITTAAISKWKTSGDRIPKPSSVKLVARAFEPYGVSSDELLHAAGYTMMPSANISEREERLLAFARTRPNTAKIIERAQLLTPSEQDELLSMVEAWLHAKTNKRKRVR